MVGQSQTMVRQYRGSQYNATIAFRHDAETMAKQGYYPISETYAPGSYGCGSFLVALLLCFILIGILVFIYMLIVKPDGTLTVTYAYRPPTAEQTIWGTRGKNVSPLCRASKIGRACVSVLWPYF
jgi:hypothetical protein